MPPTLRADGAATYARDQYELLRARGD